MGRDRSLFMSQGYMMCQSQSLAGNGQDVHRSEGRGGTGLGSDARERIRALKENEVNTNREMYKDKY